jgi:hypothetical protein
MPARGQNAGGNRDDDRDIEDGSQERHRADQYGQPS